MFDWYKTTASSGTFACKCVIEDGEMEDRSCKPVFEDKGRLWFCKWFFDILWQDWQNGSFKDSSTFAYWRRIGDLSGDKRGVYIFLSGY